MAERTEPAQPDGKPDKTMPPSVDGKLREPARDGEVLAAVLALLALGVLALDLAVGAWWAARGEGASFLGACWAALQSYLGVCTFAGVVLALLSYFLPGLRKILKDWGVFVLVLTLGPIVLWYWAGSYHWGRDFLIVGGVVIVVIALYDRVKNSLTHPKAARFSFVLVAVLLSWLLVSAGDYFFAGERLPTNAARFSELNDRPEPKRLGLALSGGGFRAALLHAGVLAALEERGIPIAGLATVSGGSIIGGFYVAGGRPEDFRDAVAAGRFNLKRELVNFPNLVRLPCPGHVPIVDVKLLWWCSFSRVDVQANLLDRVLFDGKTVAQLRSDRDPAKDWWKNPPWWVAGATDLRKGLGVGLTAEGIFGRAHASPFPGLQAAADDEPETDLRRTPAKPTFDDKSNDRTFQDTRVANLIAVSGAFPGAFGSTVLSIGKDTSLQVVDGGITDNLGYSLLMSAREYDPKKFGLDSVLISDGGMPLSAQKDVSAYSEFLRAMEVVYASSGIMVKPNRLKRVWLSPRTVDLDRLTEEDRARLPETLRAKIPTLAAFRKDFDRARQQFLETSTLKDRFENSWGVEIFRYTSTQEYLFGKEWAEAIERRLWRTEKPLSGREAVDALFTLGQYLVYINLPDICNTLSKEKC